MNKRILALAILLVCAVTAALARGGEGSWENVQGVAVGTRVQVVNMDLKSFTGAVQVVGDNAITIRTKKGDVTVSREEVYRVSLREGGHRGRNMLIGGLAGFGAGFATSYLANYEDGSFAMDWAVGAACAAGGVAVGAAWPTYATLYRAERP